MISLPKGGSHSISRRHFARAAVGAAAAAAAGPCRRWPSRPARPSAGALPRAFPRASTRCSALPTRSAGSSAS